MSLATLLQTIIATIFIYLILSLLASEIQEYIASVAEFRAKRLKESIKQLLGEAQISPNKKSKLSTALQEAKKLKESIKQLLGEAEKSSDETNKLSTELQKAEKLIESIEQLLGEAKRSSDKNKQLSTELQKAEKLIESIEQLLGEAEISPDKNKLSTALQKAKSLKESTEQLLEDKLLTESLYDKYLISSLNQKAKYNLFFWTKSAGPSYIEPKLFAQALLQTIQDNLNDEDKLAIDDKIAKNNSDSDFSLDKKLNKIKCSTNAKEKLNKIARELLLEEKEPNLAHFKAKLQELFKGVQERSSGVYKRNAKGLSLLLGLIIAIVINADTFHIVTTLSQQNNNYSEQIVNVIEDNRELFTTNEDTQDDLSEEQREQIKEVIDEIDTLPLGWDFGDSDLISKQGGFPRVIFGWLISAIAIAMGAPFWFDLLSNIMNVRNTKKTKKNN